MKDSKLSANISIPSPAQQVLLMKRRGLIGWIMLFYPLFTNKMENFVVVEGRAFFWKSMPQFHFRSVVINFRCLENMRVMASSPNSSHILQGQSIALFVFYENRLHPPRWCQWTIANGISVVWNYLFISTLFCIFYNNYLFDYHSSFLFLLAAPPLVQIIESWKQTFVGFNNIRVVPELYWTTPPRRRQTRNVFIFTKMNQRNVTKRTPTLVMLCMSLFSFHISIKIMFLFHCFFFMKCNGKKVFFLI
jgi:hypothetical protein